tara:strand:+ start:57 stop:848 length:792 start_codon:yes stop_codon:yes gene_type:complete
MPRFRYSSSYYLSDILNSWHNGSLNHRDLGYGKSEQSSRAVYSVGYALSELARIKDEKLEKHVKELELKLKLLHEEEIKSLNSKHEAKFAFYNSIIPKEFRDASSKICGLYHIKIAKKKLKKLREDKVFYERAIQQENDRIEKKIQLLKKDLAAENEKIIQCETDAKFMRGAIETDESVSEGLFLKLNGLMKKEYNVNSAKLSESKVKKENLKAHLESHIALLKDRELVDWRSEARRCSEAMEARRNSVAKKQTSFSNSNLFS